MATQITPSSLDQDIIMSNALDAAVEETLIPTHPVPQRLQGTDGRPTPHIGPTIDDYRTHHATTVGQGSDEFWAKVGTRLSPPIIPKCPPSLQSWPLIWVFLRTFSRPEKCFIGTVLSIQFVLGLLKLAISFGSPKVV